MFWTGSLFSLLWTALTRGGCASMMVGACTPEVRQLQGPHAPPVAPRTALSMAVARGTTIIQGDQARGLFPGTRHTAVPLTVETTPAGPGALVKVTASLLPNKVAGGAFTAADDCIKTLQERESRP